jgi:subtilisin family serine protease
MFARRFASLFVVGLVFATMLLVRPVAAANPHLVPDHYIVVFKANVADASAKAHGLAAQHGLTIQHTYSYALKGFAALVPAARLAQLRADPAVAYVMQDQVVSLGQPLQAKAKPGGQPPQSIPTGIDRIDAELSSQLSGNGAGAITNVAVAVIDTGIDGSHPDLNVVGGHNCSTGGASSWGDGNGHGTHVAGTIGAKDNAIGVVGVAPGVPLYAVRVLNNSGSGSFADIICGIDWVTQNASQVSPPIVAANMSLGGSGSDSTCANDAFHQAICNSVAAGITYAVAAGNESDNAANHVPAAFDEVITVSALADFNGQPGGGAASTCRADVDDTFADFSNFGADVDIIAPGVCILSTWKGSSYNTISGTSMATPHVTGAAALYISSHLGASPSQVKTALQNAGTNNWSTNTDPDGTHENLLNVSSF